MATTSKDYAELKRDWAREEAVRDLRNLISTAQEALDRLDANVREDQVSTFLISTGVGNFVQRATEAELSLQKLDYAEQTVRWITTAQAEVTTLASEQEAVYGRDEYTADEEDADMTAQAEADLS